MADAVQFRDFTRTEKAHIALLTARMAKRGMAGQNVDISDLKRKVERIEQQAARRKAKGK